MRSTNRTSNRGTGRLVALAPLFFVSVVAFVLVVPVEAQPDDSSRWRLEPTDVVVGELGDPGRTAWTVALDAGPLLANPAELPIQLPDGRRLLLTRTSWSEEDGLLTWTGRAAGEPELHSLVSLAADERSVSGVIDTGAHRYRIVPGPDGSTRVQRFVSSNSRCAGAVLPGRDLVPRPEALAAGDRPLAGVSAAAGKPTVTILVLFTTQAEAGLHGSVRPFAASAVNFLNGVLDNSGAKGTAVLAGVEVISTLDGTDNGLDNFLGAVRFDPEAARLRTVYDADIVHLFTGGGEAGGDCGIAYLLRGGDSSRAMAPWAYGTTSIRCDAESTFAHEVGHNVGLNHNPEDASTNRPFHPWSYAHRDASTKTVMSYGGQREVPHYSNPDITVEGFRTGVPNQRDNVRTLAESMFVASGYAGRADSATVIPPSDLTLTLESSTAVRLDWQDNSSDETGFRIEQRPDGASWAVVANVGADTVSAVVDGLVPGTGYDFRVKAVRSGDVSSPSNVVSLETPAFSAPPSVLTAVPVSDTEVELVWDPASEPASVPSRLLISARTPGAEEADVVEMAAFSDALAGSVVIEDLDPDTPYTFRTRVEPEAPDGAAGEEPQPVYGGEASATTLGYDGPCRDDGRSLCLLGGRFEVRVQWHNQHQADDFGVGTADPIEGSQESGLFWFFDESNVELVVKMLDARVINDAFWHYYGALSDVEYWISIRDVEAGASRTYHNRPGDQCGQGDVGAFPELATPFDTATVGAGTLGGLAHSGAESTGPCVADEQTLCLGDGRFAVQVDWTVTQPVAETGVGTVLPSLSTPETGFFWFFEETNVELAVKILDARSINDRFWFFWGGLSDQEYSIRVTDLETGIESVFENPAGSLCGGSDLDRLGAPAP